MPLETSQVSLAAALPMLQWLGITTLAGAIAFVLALYKLPPRLSIIEIKDRSPAHSFESRIIIKNIGKLPAYNVWANVICLYLTIGTTTVEGMRLSRNGRPVSKLDSDEVFNIPAIPQVGAPVGVQIDKCSYRLEVEYECKILWYTKSLKRYWNIELRNWGQGFVWQFTSL